MVKKKYYDSIIVFKLTLLNLVYQYYKIQLDLRMEVEFNIPDVLKVDQDSYVCFTGKEYLKQTRPHQQEKGLAVLSKIINTLGERSAISQKLKQIITSSSKFYGTDQRIYIKVAENKALGFVKVGQKNLFYHDNTGVIKELHPTAVLDIYVHESCQRTGIGKEIFQKFLKSESKLPSKLAYDRPSEKLISFLKKHYSLSSYVPQNNNYVIFDRFFQKQKEQKPKVTSPQLKITNQTVLQKTNLNRTKSKVQSKDSLLKLTQEMDKMNFQQTKSFKQVKDQSRSSFGCPWATQQKIGFKTTSNTYGNHYIRR